MKKAKGKGKGKGSCRILFSLLLAAAVFFGAVTPAHATLTNSSTYTTNGKSYLYSALITAASNDTTATADSNTIDNRDGSIKFISAGVKATNQTGTSPTLTVSLIGSFDNSTWFAIPTAQGSTAGTTGTMATGALSIATASTTNVSTGLTTSSFGYGTFGGFPPFIRVRVVVGGSSTPGWTGIGYALVNRGN